MARDVCPLVSAEDRARLEAIVADRNRKQKHVARARIILASAETVIGLYKTEVIRRSGPWRGLEAVELATLAWVDWFNHRRLLAPIGNVPPAEAKAAYYAELDDPALAA